MTIRPATDRFEFERDLARRGIALVAGVDEAGRGPIAGPVVAAAVMLPSEWIVSGLPSELTGLNDSKQLTKLQRGRFFAFLTTNSGVCFAIANSSPETIDRINILQATRQAMKDALAQLRPSPEHVLVDGLPVPALSFPQTAIVGGDARSNSIAAASVLAKVTRDRLMEHYDCCYPGYGFAAHKGYGTEQHLAALARQGPCPIHRRSFAPFKPVQQELL